MEIENKTVESIPAVTIRFAGDSGDGYATCWYTFY